MQTKAATTSIASSTTSVESIYIQGAHNVRPMPYQSQNVPLPPPILGPQPPPPRIMPMNQVMVEDMSQGWNEPDSRITKTYAEQSISMQEDGEYMSYLSHYVVQGDQHIPVYQTTPVNSKDRDMNNTNTRPPITMLQVQWTAQGE